MAFVNPPSWTPVVSQSKFFEPPLPGTVPAPPTFIDEEDSGFWGGVMQAGAYVALAFALEASALSGNTAVTFEAQHQDEIATTPAVVEEVYDYKRAVTIDDPYSAYIAAQQDELSRGPVIDEVYDWQQDGSIPPLDSTFPAYQAPHQDEIARGPVVEEVYSYKAADWIEPVQLPAPYWFDPNEIPRGPVVDEALDWRAAAFLDSSFAAAPQFDQGDFAPQPAGSIAYEDYQFAFAATLDAELIQIAPYGYDGGDVPQPAVVTPQNYINTGTHNFVTQDVGFGVEF